MKSCCGHEEKIDVVEREKPKSSPFRNYPLEDNIIWV